MRCLFLLAPILPLAAQGPQKPRVELGFEERVRLEDWDNILDHRDAAPDVRTHLRFRTRGWALWRPVPTLELALGLVNEGRKITRPDLAQHHREVLVERLSLAWRPVADWDLQVGRQNVARGEGFILMDGTPGDGSRTAFFDGAIGGWQRGEHRLEAMLFRNTRTDRHLGALNEAPQPADRPRLAEADESLGGFYYTGQLRKATRLEGYLFRMARRDDPRFPAKGQPDRQFNVLGARWVEALGGGFTLTAEGALERGRVAARPGGLPGQELRAWGGTARLSRAFGGPWKPTLSAGLVGLSGDNPRTPEVEGWDPVFGRFPRWSDLYVYSLGPESEVALWSNLRMTELDAKVQPRPWLGLRAAWYHLGAFQAQPQKGPTFGQGTGRGDLLLLRADLAVAPSWKAHLLYERLKAGSFYAFRDAGHFFRAEVAWTFQKAL